MEKQLQLLDRHAADTTKHNGDYEKNRAKAWKPRGGNKAHCPSAKLLRPHRLPGPFSGRALLLQCSLVSSIPTVWQAGCISSAGTAALQWRVGRHPNLPSGLPQQDCFPRVPATVSLLGWGSMEQALERAQMMEMCWVTSALCFKL